jgi:prepilin-type N-terminal cleavage/methylation domain-containing protein
MWVSSDMIVSRRARLRLSPPAAFTLVELLVSMSVLAILMVLVTQVVGQVQKTWLS